MILYLSVVITAVIAISGLNIWLGTPVFNYSAWFVIGAVVATTIFQIVIDGIFAIIVNKMPNKWFSIDKKCFQVSKKEQKFLEKLKIRKWKDKVWELGGLGGFRKNKIISPDDPKYIETFLIESNKGITTHRIGYFAGFLGVFLFPLKYALVIGLPVALVNLFLNILPTLVLKYNIPKLNAVLSRLKKKAQNNTQCLNN